MEKEFNLSEKIYNSTSPHFQTLVIEVSYIKEFIRLLKEVVLKKGRRALPDIDKLAGDKLI